MTATYAWIIDKDHLAVDWGIEGEEPEDEAGTTGPSDADPVALKLLTGGGSEVPHVRRGRRAVLRGSVHGHHS